MVVCRNAFHLLPEPVAALAARLREPAHRRHHLEEQLDDLIARAGLQVTQRGRLRRTIDLDCWLQAAAAPAAKAGLIRGRFRELPVDVQARMDMAFADRLVAFSYDMVDLRLERA